MKISCFQFQPLLNSFESNVAKILEAARKCDSQILVFPELAVSAYFFRNREEARQAAIEYINSNLYATLCEISSQKNMIIVYGFPEIDGDKQYNSAQIIFPDSTYNRIYRKTHLFYNEINCFDFGDSGFFNIYYPPFDLNLGTMICYDWRFPEATRTLALLGADLVVCPSNLVTKIWPKVMPGRAIENKVYVAVANRMGSDIVDNEELSFNGVSAIYSYNGDELAAAGADDEIMINAEIHPEKTRDKSFNKYNDIFKDRRTEYYK